MLDPEDRGRKLYHYHSGEEVSPENSEVLIKALNALTELLQIGGTLIALLPSPLSSPQFLALKIKK